MDDVTRSTMRAPRPSSRRGRRALAALAVGLVGALLLSGCWSANQDTVLKKVNEYRVANAKRAVAGNAAAMSKAQKWSQHMARTGVLEHSGGGSKIDPSGLPRNCGYAENVAMSSSIDGAMTAFKNSPTHRANMLGAYTHLGTGVVRSGTKVWVTQVFYKAC